MKIRIFTCSLPQHESARAAALRQRGASSPGWVLRGLIHFKPPFYPKNPTSFPQNPFSSLVLSFSSPGSSTGLARPCHPTPVPMQGGDREGWWPCHPPALWEGSLCIRDPPLQGPPLQGVGQWVPWVRLVLCPHLSPPRGCDVSDPKEKKK